MQKKILLILTALASLTMANAGHATTDEDVYRIVHKCQKLQLPGRAYGFVCHDDLVAFQALLDEITPEKLDDFLASHKYLPLDNLYVTIIGTEKPHRVHVSLTGAPYWMDASQLPEEN